MKKSFIEIVMNPVRLRILQYLMIHQTGTVGEMRQELSDIPPASLYRHIRILADAGCIEVAEKNQIRGTVEKTYRLSKNPNGDQNQEFSTLFQQALLSLLATFQHYFSKEEHDPVKDMLSISTSALMMTDEEYLTFLQKIGGVLEEAIRIPAAKERKPRRFTIISSPCEETSEISQYKT